MTPKIATPAKHNLLLVISYLIGVLIALASCVVLAAWYLHLTTILQINPSYVPMQFNTALAFLSCGVGLYLTAKGKQQNAAIIGSIAGVVGLLTVSEYVFGVTLGVDNFFINTYIMTTIRYPGRMAPISACCFLFFSSALWLSWRATINSRWSMVGLIGSLVAGFGVIGTLGYFTNLPVTFVWGNFSSMALHTSLAFVLLGIGLIAHTFRSEAQCNIEPGVWRAIAVALATLTIFVGATQAMLASEENALQSKAEVVARAETAQTRTMLELQMQAIERMAERAEIRQPSEEEWKADASRYVEHAKGIYDSIEILDHLYQVRWKISFNETAPKRVMFEDFGALFDVSKPADQVRLIRIINPTTSKTNYLILAPIYRKNIFEGLIVAVINPYKLFEELQMITEKPYDFTVQSGSEILYSSRKDLTSDVPWVRSVDGSLGEVEWTMQVWPIDRTYTSAPWFVLLAGILSASALTVLVLKSQAVNARLRELLTIIDTAPIGMLVLDGEGYVRKINEEGNKLFGYSHDEILGAQVNTLIHNSRGSEFTKESDSYVAQPALCQRKDGSEVFTEVGINHIFINGKEHILVVVTDVSQRKRAEAELEEKSIDLMRSNKELEQLQQMLQTTIDHMPALVGSWDAKFRNRFANKAYIKWFDMTPEQMRGKYMWDIIGKDRFDQLKPQLLSVLEGNTEVFERTLTFPNGELHHGVFSYVPDIENGVVVGYYGFVSDVTLLKQAQIAKENVLTQLQDIIDAAKDYAIVETDKNGVVTLFSRGAEILLGYSALEIVGKQNMDLFHSPSELQAYSQKATQQLGRDVSGFNAIIEMAGAQESASRDWTYVHKDGTELLVNLSVAKVHDKSGEVSGYLGIAKDIRKEKEFLRALADARDKAQSANLAKSQFLANMSHEIRTPMNAILGMLQLLQHTTMTTRQLDYTLKTQSAAQALLGLLNDILDFSKVEAGKMKLENAPFDLDSLMRDLSVIFSSSVGDKEIDVLFSIDPRLPRRVYGDEMRLRQVLINLAGNAIKFTQHGSVVVSLSVTTQDDRQSKIGFSVQDTGIGIGPEQLDYVFEGFSQAEASTTRRFGGTGLGLAISQRLVALMGGKLEVASALNIGSRFYFSLTLDHAIPAVTETATAIALPTSPHKRQVLIVDDSAPAREILHSMVTSLGWHADVAASGAAALVKLKQNEGGRTPYDVVFMDWKMPGMDGVETASQMRRYKRQNGEPIIIIMVTAHDREVLVKQLRQDRSLLNGFLVKPVTASMLYDAVVDATTSMSSEPGDAGAKPHNLRLAGMKILVVEDNLINQEVARELLRSEGAQVAVANDGREGVDRLLAPDADFEVVLMDIQMPIMDGYEATRAIRQHADLQMLPIIATTANAMASDKEACRVAGMNEHVAKPIDIDNLVNAILRCCGKTPEANKFIEPRSIADTASVNGNDADPIELNEALKRLGGNTDLFISLAARFPADLTTMIADFRRNMEQNQPSKAAMVMHTVKGVAGTIGAVLLADYANDIESQLKLDPADFDFASHAKGLQTLAEQASTALEMISSQLRASPDSPNSEQKTIDTLFAELDTLLQNSNMQAVAVFLKLQERLAENQSEFQTKQLLALAGAIHSLDFKLSLQHSQQLRKSLR